MCFDSVSRSWQRCLGVIRSHRSRSRRSGAILLLSVFLLVIMLGLCAFAVDLGMVVLARNEIQVAVDSGAMAATGLVGSDPVGAMIIGEKYVQFHDVIGFNLPAESIDVELGEWDRESRSFQPSDNFPNTVRVSARYPDAPLFFGRIFGHQIFSVESEAVGSFRPRDVMIVLDCSGSMNDDSELKSIDHMTQPAVEDNLLQIYDELGSPIYGNMQWQPVELGGSDSDIKTALGLDNVPYPYAGGSWGDFVNYVQGDNDVRDAGYENMFGYLTLVNYWLEKRPKYTETPDLWMTSEQPITAVKDGVTEFITYLLANSPTDRVGPVVYTHDNSSAANLESGLTRDLALINFITRHRQAGHYTPMTNIGAGMKKARLELEANARNSAFKLMVLMTDGQANRPGDSASAKQYVLDEAQLAADAEIMVATLSVGAGADTNLMQQVADMTGGVHFNVPGGQTVA